MSESNDRQADSQREPAEAAKMGVDEDWKKSVQEERQKLQEEAEKKRPAEQARPKQYPQPDLSIFLAGLYSQTLVTLGEIENPLTKKKEQDLPEAQYLIDTIGMLKEKTKGNLTPEEDDYLASLLHNLRMRYVAAAGQPQRPQEPERQ